jgi:putative ABC transport system permease protein
MRGVFWRLLGRLLPGTMREALIDELRTDYRRRVTTRGGLYATRRLLRELVSLDLIRLHGVTNVSPVAQGVGLGALVAGLLREIVIAVRALIRAPLFTLTAVTTLALGIGANTAVFSVASGVLLRSLPYHEPDKLFFIWDNLEWIGVPRAWAQPAEIPYLRERATLFSDVAGLDAGSVQVTGLGEPRQLRSGAVTENLFSVLGVEAEHGRLIRLGDGEPGANLVTVLNHGLWVREFGGDRNVLGQVVNLDGQPTEIVGILPEQFDFVIHTSLGEPYPAEIWLPIQEDLATIERGSHSLAVLARVRPDVTAAQALDQLAQISRESDEAFYGSNGFRFDPVPVHGDLVKEVRPALLVLTGAVGFVLLIAAANLATLLMARAQQRDREIAMRYALGASRGRLLAHTMAEGLLLAVIGGMLGVLVAIAGVDILLALAPSALPRSGAIGVDLPVLAFTGGITILAGLLCGAAPAWQSYRLDLTGALKDGARGAGHSVKRRRARRAIVGFEVVVAVVLLTGAALMIRSFRNLIHVDAGFGGENVLTAEIDLSGDRYPEPQDRTRVIERMISAISGLPGVVAVAATSAPPLSANANQAPALLDVPDATDESGRLRAFVDYSEAYPGYFGVMGIDVVRGRSFASTDRADAPPVVVVDETLAGRWPDGNPVGRSLQFFGTDWTVVGVVRHARQYTIEADDRPQVYFPYPQRPQFDLAFTVRTTRDPTELASAVRQAVWSVDPNQPVENVRTMVQAVEDSMSARRFSMTLLSAFAVVAVVLAALGIYGVLSFTVTQRRSEIGVRLALGAGRGAVIRGVMRDGLIVTGAGILVGIGAAVVFSRFLGSMVYGVSTLDPVSFVLVPCGLAIIAALSSLLPAWRASRVDPAIALRD